MDVCLDPKSVEPKRRTVTYHLMLSLQTRKRATFVSHAIAQKLIKRTHVAKAKVIPAEADLEWDKRTQVSQ